MVRKPYSEIEIEACQVDANPERIAKAVNEKYGGWVRIVDNHAVGEHKP
jgi:hypothetical protein